MPNINNSHINLQYKIHQIIQQVDSDIFLEKKSHRKRLYKLYLNMRCMAA